MKAMIEISGSEASIAPQKLERLAISEIVNIRIAEITILIKYCIQDMFMSQKRNPSVE